MLPHCHVGRPRGVRVRVEGMYAGVAPWWTYESYFVGGIIGKSIKQKKEGN